MSVHFLLLHYRPVFVSFFFFFFVCTMWYGLKLTVQHSVGVEYKHGDTQIEANVIVFCIGCFHIKIII